MSLPPNFKKLIEITANYLGLNYKAVVEKDYYVTKVLHALADVENDYYQLIFIGGTCLAKAHRIVQRMSEDIDFKIIPKPELKSLGKNTARNQIRVFRQTILKAIEEKAGLDVQPEQVKVRNESRFTQIFINYPSLYPVNPVLRQNIKIELTVQPIYTPIEKLSVTSLIKEVIGEKIDLPIGYLNCISIHETAAEKWVALARRVAESERQENPDKSIIRHLFDLHQMETKRGINNSFEQLIPQTILKDREQFKSQSPNFYQNTMRELQFGLESLEHNSSWAKSYNHFLNNMVFQKEKSPDYRDTLFTLNKLNQRALRAINHLTLPEFVI